MVGNVVWVWRDHTHVSPFPQRGSDRIEPSLFRSGTLIRGTRGVLPINRFNYCNCLATLTGCSDLVDQLLGQGLADAVWGQYFGWRSSVTLGGDRRDDFDLGASAFTKLIYTVRICCYNRVSTLVYETTITWLDYVGSWPGNKPWIFVWLKTFSGSRHWEKELFFALKSRFNNCYFCV